MKFLLDTNICIYIIKKKPEKVLKKFKTFNPGDIAISNITVAEMYYGIEKSGRPAENLIALLEFLQPLVKIDFGIDDAHHYGKVRYGLESRGKPIGAMDLLIASQALARNLVLVTNNEKEFKRIKNITVENWTK